MTSIWDLLSRTHDFDVRVVALGAGRIDVHAADDLVTVEDGVGETAAFLEVTGVSFENSARLSARLIGVGQSECSNPGVARMCSMLDIQAM